MLKYTFDEHADGNNPVKFMDALVHCPDLLNIVICGKEFENRQFEFPHPLQDRCLGIVVVLKVVFAGIVEGFVAYRPKPTSAITLRTTIAPIHTESVTPFPVSCSHESASAFSVFAPGFHGRFWSQVKDCFDSPEINFFRRRFFCSIGQWGSCS